MEQKNVERILEEILITYELEFAYKDALKIFGEYRKKHRDELAYVYALVNILTDYKKPPLVDLDVFSGDEVLRLLAGKIRVANYSPYRELLSAKMYRCAAEYAYEKERSALLVKEGTAYLLSLTDIPEP